MTEEKHDITGTARIIYILYLVGVAFGITGLIGVIMAYANRSDAPEWLASHYRFQIRTFWLCLLYAILMFVIAFVLLSPIMFAVGVVVIMVLPHTQEVPQALPHSKQVLPQAGHGFGQ